MSNEELAKSFDLFCKLHVDIRTPHHLLDAMGYHYIYSYYYYYSLFNTLDDSAFIANHKEEMISRLNNALKRDISLKSYKEAGFNIRYEYHSSTSPKLILLEKTFTPEDYSN